MTHHMARFAVIADVRRFGRMVPRRGIPAARAGAAGNREDAAAHRRWTSGSSRDIHVATITPLARPQGFGDRLVLTAAEAAAMEKYKADRQVKNDAPLKGDREAPPVGGSTVAPKTYLEILEQFGGGVVGGYNNFWLRPAQRSSASMAKNARRSSSILRMARCRK